MSAAAASTNSPTPIATARTMRRPDAVGKRHPHAGHCSACVEMGLPQSRHGERDTGREDALGAKERTRN